MLSLLSVCQPLQVPEIAAHIAYTGVDLGTGALQSLVQRGLLVQEAGGLRLSPSGSDAILHVLAAAVGRGRSSGPHGRDGIGCTAQPAQAGHLCTDPGLPKLWQATAPAQPAA